MYDLLGTLFELTGMQRHVVEFSAGREFSKPVPGSKNIFDIVFRIDLCCRDYPAWYCSIGVRAEGGFIPFDFWIDSLEGPLATVETSQILQGVGIVGPNDVESDSYRLMTTRRMTETEIQLLRVKRPSFDREFKVDPVNTLQ